MVVGALIGSVVGRGRDGIVCVCRVILALFLFLVSLRLEFKLIRLSPWSSSPPIPDVNNDITLVVSSFRSRSCVRSISNGCGIFDCITN